MILTQTAQTTKTAIRYDRSARAWLAINGTTTTHPTKNAALLAALANDWPELYPAVKSLLKIHKSPTFENGIIKAAKLLVTGKVYANGDVASQSQPGVSYTTSYGGLVAKYACTCPATVTEPIIGKCCAHVLAQHLAYIAGLELPSPPHYDDLTDDSNVPF